MTEREGGSCSCGCGGSHGDEGDKAGHFQGFVLLDTVEIDVNSIMERLKEEWEIEPDEEERGCDCDCGHDAGCGCGHDEGCDCGHEHGDAQDDCCSEEGTRVFHVGNCLVAISLIPMPVPEGEAEFFARSNYMWPEAEAVTKTHKAHILVAVLPHGGSAVEAAKLYTKLVCACLKQDNALGVYTSGTVYQPEFYLDVAEFMRQDELPILDWIFVGLYCKDGGNSAYTYGLKAFGKDEIEVVDSGRSLKELRDFLHQIVCYVIEYDVTLMDGETIGLTEDEQLPIVKSKGAVLEGETLKISC